MNREEMIEKAFELCQGVHLAKCGNECPYYINDPTEGCKPMDDRTDEELKAVIDADQGEEDQPDMVNHPNHYMLECGKDCFDVMVELFGREAVQTYCILNSFTYLWRHARKNGTEDVLKAEYNLAKFKELEIGRIFE